MSDAVFVPVHPQLRSFLDTNPGLGVLGTDFYRDDLLALMNFGSADRAQIVEAARAHASLARLTDDPNIVDRLYRCGLHSAAAIANTPVHTLRERLDEASNDGAGLSETTVADIHAAAVDLHSRAIHLASEMRAALSPHGRAPSGNHAARLLAAEFGHLPSFTDLFGSQDYIPAPHCQSVVGPAAYLVDLMRVVDEQITSNPKNDIPDWALLERRRSGLFTQPLTCAETLTPVPKLQIINRVIHDFLVPQLGADTDYAIATRVFPYNLPINVRLVLIRAVMAQLGAPLVELYATYVGHASGLATMPDAASVAAEHLNLSPEQRQIVTTARTGQALVDCFGGDPGLLAQPLKATVTTSRDSLTVTGSGFLSAAKPASILSVGDTLRAVVTVVSDTELKVDQAWLQDKAGADGLFYPPGALVQTNVLGRRTHLDDAAIAALFVDGLDADEIAAGLADKLYINAARNCRAPDSSATAATLVTRCR